MTYYIQDVDGRIFKGKADKYRPGMIPYRAKLYNPYTKRTVIGWNNYKEQMRTAERQRYKRR